MFLGSGCDWQPGADIWSLETGVTGERFRMESRAELLHLGLPFHESSRQ